MGKVIPFAAAQVLELEQDQNLQKITISLQQVQKKYVLSRKQVLILNSLILFSLTLMQSVDEMHPEFALIRLLYTDSSSNIEKLKCFFIGYFGQIVNLPEEIQDLFYNQKITYERHVLNNLDIQLLFKQNSGKKLTKVFHEPEAKIEEIEYPFCTQVDFANEYIGGGALGYGNVQEEIAFTVHPECYISQLLFQKMKKNEAISFQGTYRYANYIGYGFTFTFKQENDLVKLIKTMQSPFQMVGIDAMDFRMSDPAQQFNQKYFQREIMKSFTGFSAGISQNGKQGPVVTGNWGCGIFAGDVQLKFFIQWMSCTLNNRDIIYCSFWNELIVDKIEKVVKKVQNYTIQQIYQMISLYNLSGKQQQLFDFILEQ
ncbi:hypothetical protein PPERSA_06327 [Pseudocohnilembus persalinus]|uniref:PARG catalytic Macro domain-containing protein n=1 Tax=Pseudocohnilembus persalinus TaxID=266149 RepID=A0A0V0QIS7_PSEPJ|nr:hypothetical protein PPERSA_06327 [Pseudocohnilembus persalinus]|eukprot:KRX02132.1 hypothetical protein PPERSA_06327 [Pseudocohnilembus persalinus]